MASTYIYAEDYTDFEAQLEETWDLEGEYRLVDVEYIDDQWAGVFVDNGLANAINTDETFSGLQKQISNSFEEDYDLVDIDYVDDTWIAVFDKDSSIQSSDYELALDVTELVEDAETQFDNGSQLIDVEYANGNWVGVFGKSAEQSAINTADSLTGFKSVVTQRRAEEFDLVGVEYAEDSWVGVFTKDPFHTTKYAIANDTDEFLTKFEQR